MVSFRIVCVVFVLLTFSSSLLAQTSKGFIVGNVFDPGGAVIAGANIKITNTSTGVTRDVVSGSDGTFRLDAVDPGAYRIEVSQTGFKTTVTENVVVGASQTTSVSIKLDIGTQTEVVNVTSGVDVILQTQDGTRVNTLSRREITDLPTPALNPANVVFTLPGV